jgi:hypothetical protein
VGGRDGNAWIGPCKSTCPEGYGPSLGGHEIDLSYNKAVMIHGPESEGRQVGILNLYSNVLNGNDINHVFGILGEGQANMKEYFVKQWKVAKQKLGIVSDSVGYRDGKIYVLYKDATNAFISAGIPVGRLLAVMGCPARLRGKVSGRIREVFKPVDVTFTMPRWKNLPKTI